MGGTIGNLGVGESGFLTPGLSTALTNFGGLGQALLGTFAAVAGSAALGLSSVETTAHATASQPSTTHYLLGSLSENVVLPPATRQSVAPGSQTPVAKDPLTTTGGLSGQPGAAGTATHEPTSRRWRNHRIRQHPGRWTIG